MYSPTVQTKSDNTTPNVVSTDETVVYPMVSSDSDFNTIIICKHLSSANLKKLQMNGPLILLCTIHT